MTWIQWLSEHLFRKVALAPTRAGAGSLLVEDTFLLSLLSSSSVARSESESPRCLAPFLNLFDWHCTSVSRPVGPHQRGWRAQVNFLILFHLLAEIHIYLEARLLGTYIQGCINLIGEYMRHHYVKTLAWAKHPTHFMKKRYRRIIKPFWNLLYFYM